MILFWLATFILVSGFAIAAGKGVKWKLLNAAVILGCMALGFGIGYAVGLGSVNMGFVRNAGWPFAVMFGIVGALGCLGPTVWRAK